MSNGGDLLRMLMPAVRPVPTEGARQAKPPIESQSFDSLLQEAKQTEGPTGLQADHLPRAEPVSLADETKPVEISVKPDTLAPLSGLDSIHNASIRRIVADATGK